MGLLGALKGVGDAAASVGQTGVNYSFQQERDKTEEMRQRAIAKYQQQLGDESFTARNDVTASQNRQAMAAQAEVDAAKEASRRDFETGMKAYDTSAKLNELAQENEYKRDAATIKADADERLERIKVGGDLGTGKPTTAAKEYQEMLRLGVPPEQARAIAYSGSYKTISDPNTGATVLIDLASGNEAGRFASEDPKNPFGKMSWQPAGARPPSGAAYMPKESSKATLQSIMDDFLGDGSKASKAPPSPPVPERVRSGLIGQ